MTCRCPCHPQLARGPRAARLAGLLGAALAWLVLALPAAEAQVSTIHPDGAMGIEVRKGTILRLERPAAAVFVADPDIADVQAQSPTMIYLFGRRAGTTTLFAVDEDDDVILRRSVIVSHDLTRLQAAFDSLMPDSRIRLASIDGSIVLDGQVGSAEAADEARRLAGRFLGDSETLINRIKVEAATQVHLRVRVAEVSRDVSKEFGINWEGVFQTGNFVFGFAHGRDVINDVGQFLRSPTDASSVAGRFVSGSADVSTLVDLLEREGLVHILAEPNLTALSGETASFLAGGEFPVPVGVQDGEVRVQFKEFGVSLSFTPTVLNDQRISLRVRPEVSEITDRGSVTLNGFVIPGLATRRAETTVELGSGQTFAIGGLLTSDIQSAVQKLPGLGDLPVLGALFRSQTFQRAESELVILVTPYVVRPMSDPASVALPTDGYRPPSDVERILEGRLHRAGIRQGGRELVGAGGARLAGPVGFVLD